MLLKELMLMHTKIINTSKKFERSNLNFKYIQNEDNMSSVAICHTKLNRSQ